MLVNRHLHPYLCMQPENAHWYSFLSSDHTNAFDKQHHLAFPNLLKLALMDEVILRTLLVHCVWVMFWRGVRHSALINKWSYIRFGIPGIRAMFHARPHQIHMDSSMCKCLACSKSFHHIIKWEVRKKWFIGAHLSNAGYWWLMKLWANCQVTITIQIF